MRDLTLRGARDVSIREAAAAVIKAAGVRPRDYLGEILALFRFVRDRIRYTRDVVDVETLQSPQYTLRSGIGDCDDKSILLAALLRSIGHPAALTFRAIGTDRRTPSQFRHVYVVAQIAGRSLALDPTNPKAGLGWEFPFPTVSMGVAL